MDTPESLEKNRPPTEKPEAPEKPEATEKPEASVSGNGGTAPSDGGGDSTLTIARPAGGVLADISGGGVPAGLFTSTLGLKADVSKEMQDLAPTFGDVLLSIGTGVADSQTQLDKGLVETAKHLSNTNIDVVTEVIQILDNDGLPSKKTKLIKNNVSLINFVNPTVHEWKHVALSMDLTVGAMDNESGMSFNQTQIKTGGSGYYIWGFGGWFNADYSQKSEAGFSRTRQETDWASGQIRLDAMMGPRETTKFPVPAEVTIGPSITFSQGSVKDIKPSNVVTGRTIDILIDVRKKDGSPNPNVGLDADTDRFALSWASDANFTGSTTNAQGKAKVTITRDIPSPAFSRPARVRLMIHLGDIKKELEVIL